MKIQLLKILLVGSMFFFHCIGAKELVNSSDNNISLRIEKLNKQITVDKIDTFKLRMEYKEIYELMKTIPLEKRVSVYLLLIKNISNIELKSISHLLRRISLEDIFINEMKQVIDSHIFSIELQTHLMLGIEKYILLIKEPLLSAVKNDGKSLMENAKKNMEGKNLTKEKLKAASYMYDYAQQIMEKNKEIELDALKSGSFVDLNNIFEEKRKKFLVEYIPPKNITKELAFKQYLEHTGAMLGYMGMYNNLERLYKNYMYHIKNNEIFLENYN